MFTVRQLQEGSAELLHAAVGGEDPKHGEPDCQINEGAAQHRAGKVVVDSAWRRDIAHGPL